MHGMLSSLARTGRNSTPARTSYVRPQLPMKPLQTASWRTSIGTMLGNIQRRWFSSLKEFFEKAKTREDAQKYRELIAKQNKPLSPSGAHLVHYFTQKNAVKIEEASPPIPLSPVELWESNFKKPNVDITLLDNIMVQEKKFTDAGYHVLYHSTQPLYYAMHYLDTAISRLHRQLTENISVHKQIPLILRQGTSPESIAEHEAARKRLLAEGPSGEDLPRGSGRGDMGPDRKYLLACNVALTGNVERPGECTLDYWAQGRSIIEADQSEILSETIPNILTNHTEILAIKHQRQIQDAVSRLNNALKTGVLLQLVFKNPTLFKETTYSARPWGFKHAAVIHGPSAPSTHGPLIRETHDILEIMNLFKSSEQKITTDSIDTLQFRVVLTADKLLDVFNKEIYENFEIHAYANPQKVLEEFHQEIQRIMQQIEQDFNNVDVARQIEKELQEKLANFSLYAHPSDLNVFLLHRIRQSLAQYNFLEKQLIALQKQFGFETTKYKNEATNNNVHGEQYDYAKEVIGHTIQMMQNMLEKTKNDKNYSDVDIMFLKKQEADFTQLLKELNEHKQKRFDTPPSLLRPDE